jgi:trehalose synthase-fused probable maltokinase
VSGAGLFDEALRAEIERNSLAPFLYRQRWFGGKARGVSSARFADWAALQAGDHPPLWLTIVELTYEDGGIERYHLPLVVLDAQARPPAGGGRAESVLHVIDADGACICDALVNDDASSAIVHAILHGTSIRGRRGEIEAGPASSPVEIDGALPRMPIVRLPAVHSNSAMAIGDHYLLKLFRRIEHGINPDVEIGRFLVRQPIEVRVPRLVGTMEYRTPHDAPAILALIQELVRSHANAWDFMLGKLAVFFESAHTRTPLTPDPETIETLARPSIAAAALVGRRTAELHRALAGATDDPDFVPDEATRADLDTLTARIAAESAAYLDLLADRSDTFEGETRTLALRVLSIREALLERIRVLGRTLQPFVRIRTHGDYHLGQVLCTDDDFAIIDFEGEPTRPLAERRARQSPLRDVAGMLRSLSYAARAGMVAASAATHRSPAELAAWSAAWEGAMSAAFLQTYLDVTQGCSFVPADRSQVARAVDLFMIEKAMYELNYEMNNRPDWVSVPLNAILALAGRGTTA